MLSLAVRTLPATLPSADRRDIRPHAVPASTSVATLLSLQSIAGNEAVVDLLTRSPALSAERPIAVQRCGGEVHEGCACAGEDGEAQVQREAEASSPSTAAGEADSTPDCPGIPDPHGEWMTEPWLCEMRQEPLYSNRRLLAPGARGRSVELLHRVLQDWICLKTADGDPPSHTLPDWRSDRHTEATSSVVRDFQADVRATMREGIVGPETLSLLDGHVGGPDRSRLPSECRPEPTIVPGGTCPPREAGEESASASDRLILRQGTPRSTGRDSERQILSISGFTVDDASVDKGPESALDDLADSLDRASPKPRKPGGGRVECWDVESATVFGFADCAEEPSLGRARADAVVEAVEARTVGADLAIDEAPSRPAGDATAVERGRNRSVLVVVERRLADVAELSGSALDDLLAEFTRRRTELESRYGERIIGLAAQLANGANDEYIDLSGAKEISDQPFPGDCIDSDTYPWRSARKDLGRMISASVDADEFCTDGIPPSVEHMMDALESLQKDMASGISKLRLEAARGSISSKAFGCPCMALKELWRRSLDSRELYHAMAGHHNFEGDPTKEDCTNP
jgi:hypothetical protein